MVKLRLDQRIRVTGVNPQMVILIDDISHPDEDHSDWQSLGEFVSFDQDDGTDGESITEATDAAQAVDESC